MRIVAGATPKREYYYQSAAGNRLFELGLGPIGLAAVGASSPGDQARITAAAGGDEPFPVAFFRAQGLIDVAEFLRRPPVARVA